VVFCLGKLVFMKLARVFLLSLLITACWPGTQPNLPAQQSAPLQLLASEPISNEAWFKGAAYGVFFHYLPREGSYPILAAPDGTWNQTIAEFDTVRFAADVKATGAAYVIFTVGQNTGYYVSPNDYFTTKTGTFAGQYVSERDLIADLADALAAQGIKLFVYMTADGPIAAPDAIKAGLGVIDTNAGPAARESVKGMISEWSQRWGKRVAGWWLDGCYPGVAGYGNPEDGEQNIDALLQATLVGNPDALTTCNPSSQNFKPVSLQQNYIAGEEDFFHRYPTALPETFKGKELTWHVLSYLGGWWGDGLQVRYPPEQLARYVQHVADRGGVVTIDMGVQANGALFPWQLETLKHVKRVVRDGETMQTSNLALYKVARLMSHTRNVELPTNGGDNLLHYASYATDGVSYNPFGDELHRRFALAGDEWAWSLLLDLDTATAFSKAVVTFPPEYFPTNVDLEVSDDAASWRVVAHAEPTIGGTSYTLQFPSVTARYVRLKANKPDAENQTGVQMGVSELELYKK
jgi:hypothetical protein